MARISILHPLALVLLCASAGCAQAGVKTAPADTPAAGVAQLEPGQRAAVEAAMEEADCTCGRGSLAGCRQQQPACPRSERAFAQAVELARLGQNAEEIAAAIAGAPTAETAPLPARHREKRPETGAGTGHPAHEHAHPEEMPLGHGKN